MSFRIPNQLKKFDKKQARMGMNVEKEHQDVTHGDTQMTAKIAAAHLREDPKYYSKLKKVEESISNIDEQYLNAVNRGDMEEVKKMVDDAAKSAGYHVGPVSHATNTKFNIFKLTERGRFGRGIYFSDKYYSSRGKYNVLVYLKNPKITQIKSPWKQESPKWTPDVYNEYFVINPNQIKSADPVTYDEQGNIIPLSRRFNEQSDDIRESISKGFPKFESTYQQIIQEIKCWKGYKKRGTKQKGGKTVNNCVKESTEDTLARIWEVYNQLKGKVSSSNVVEFPQLYKHLHMPWPEVVPALKYIGQTNWNNLFLEPHERPKSVSPEEQPFLIGNYFYLNSF